MNCSNCGKEITAESKFCPQCGKEIFSSAPHAGVAPPQYGSPRDSAFSTISMISGLGSVTIALLSIMVSVVYLADSSSYEFFNIFWVFAVAAAIVAIIFGSKINKAGPRGNRVRANVGIFTAIPGFVLSGIASLLTIAQFMEYLF